MMQNHANKKESAVSPVVGVMLMLVVTIIIAGIVAVFAGGIAGNQETIPTAVISAEYSQTNGLTLNHAGGDVIDFTKANIIVSPSAGFGSGYRTLYWEVNPSKNKLDAGESITIASPVQNRKYDQGTPAKADNAQYSAYGFNNAKNLGSYFTLKIEQNGKTVAETEVRIDP